MLKIEVGFKFFSTLLCRTYALSYEPFGKRTLKSPQIEISGIIVEILQNEIDA